MKRKYKTKKSVANRFKITKTGKVLRLSSFRRHLKRKKSKKQLRRLKRKKLVTGAMAKKIKKLLGY
ncbi:50S ribosomal protein L35 [bacterium]|nr:50S ribosomal protein L35 [bacterium]